MRFNPLVTRACGLACACFLQAACATHPATGATPTALSGAPSLPNMRQSDSSQKHIVERLAQALRTERMLAPEFFNDAALAAWFGDHKRTSTPSPLKQGVQREQMVFEKVELNFARQLSGKGFSFSLESKDHMGLNGMKAEELVVILGEPQKKVDIVADQLASPPRYPVATDGQVISPQPLRKRGETTHPLGNHDLTWRWASQTTSVEIMAAINGDGTVQTVNGRQDKLQQP